MPVCARARVRCSELECLPSQGKLQYMKAARHDGILALTEDGCSHNQLTWLLTLLVIVPQVPSDTEHNTTTTTTQRAVSYTLV